MEILDQPYSPNGLRTSKSTVCYCIFIWFSLLDPKPIDPIWCGDAGELGEAEAEPKRAGEALGPLEVATLFELVLNFYQKKYGCLVGDY